MRNGIRRKGAGEIDGELLTGCRMWVPPHALQTWKGTESEGEWEGQSFPQRLQVKQDLRLHVGG